MTNREHKESDWTVVLRADLVRPGQQFLFSEELGGEGEWVTVVANSGNLFGTVALETEEFDFDIEVQNTTMLTVREETGP